ncbi:hypothetical protein HDU97_008786 [Phlyctochytrium planicorne]|nr:hypothetical protein HDU97_008786 [Phlyctochytrium planicorne]
MKFITIISLMGALLTSTTLAQTCSGPAANQICLSNCKGKGKMVKAPQLITDITLGPTFTLDFENGEAKASTFGVKVGLDIPASLGAVALDFSKAGASIGVGLPGGPSVGRIRMDTMQDAQGTTDKNLLKDAKPQVTLDMNKVPFGPAAGLGGFQQLFRAITLGKGPIPMELNGYASNMATVRTPGDKSDASDPTVCLEYVSFVVPSSLIGLEGLTDATITELPVIKAGEASSGIELAIKLKVRNPSNIILNLNDDVVFDLTFDGQKVGSVILPNMKLALGENNFLAKSFINPDKGNGNALAATRKLMSQFTGGQASQVVVRNGKANKTPSLDAALGAVTIPQQLMANQEKLIKGALADGQTYDPPEKYFGFITYFNSSLTLTNPFDVPVRITKAVGTLSYKGSVCVFVNVDSDFSIPPKGTIVSPPLPITIDTRQDKSRPLSEVQENTPSDPNCDEFVSAQLGQETSLLDIQQTLTIFVGNYENTIDYSQPQVPVKTKF